MSQRNVDSKCSDGMSLWLIRHAARRAPESFSQRLEEEWRADLSQRPSAMSRLRFAIGCCWATQVIAFEHRPTQVPAASPVMEAKLVAGYAQHDVGYFSRRSGTFFLVASLHAVVFYVLLNMVYHIHREVPPGPLQYHPVNDPPPHEPLQFAKPGLEGVTLDVPTPVVEISRELDLSKDVPVHFGEPQPPFPPLTTPQPVKRVQGGPGVGFPNADDFYPSLARFKNEQGAATVNVCVDANGRLTSAPTTLQGSGSARLDEGALKLARAGSGHYRATTEDGRPVASCYPFRVRFQLKN